MGKETAEIKALKHTAELSRIYRGIGYEKRAKQVGACGKTYSLWVCHECGEFCYLQEYHCGDRLCERCGRARVSRLLESYGGALKAVKSPKMVTISMRSRPAGELADAVKELWDAFRRLRHRQVWKVVRGAIVSLEITWNAGGGCWHPHLHIVVESSYLDWNLLRRAWEECSEGEGRAVYIQRCRKGWERELIKYVTKVADLMTDVDALKEFVKFARGKRFIRTYGTLYNCAANREETAGVPVCRSCGVPMHCEQVCCRIEDVYGKEVAVAYGKERVSFSNPSYGVT